MKKLTGLTLALAMVGGSWNVASAVVSTHQNDQYEIKLPSYETLYYSSPSVDQARQATATGVSAELGGRWGVYEYNPIAKSASSVIGSGYETGLSVATEAAAEFAGRSVLAQNASALSLDANNLRFDGAPRGAGKVGVHFQQTYQGIDVLGGHAQAIFLESTGRVFVMGADYYKGIDLDATPSLSSFQAEEIAQISAPFNPATDGLDGETQLFVLPVPNGPESAEYHLVWRVRVETADPIGIWVTDVDAHSGDILQRTNDVHFLDFQGNTQAGIQVNTYCDGETTEVASYMQVQVSGVGTTVSDVDGNWTVPYAGTDSRTVTATLFGNYVNVNVSGGTDASFSGTATPGTPFTVEFNDGNARQDERDVYEAVNDIHDFFELFDAGWSRTNTRITANVAVSGTCNAFYNGTINFYEAGGGCANTGEIQGVVHHEYGHGVQASLLGGTQGNQGLGEGNSDVLANLLTQESIIGRGFNNNCTLGIRDSDNELIYPDDLNGSIHHDGQIIAGFHWDAMQIFQGLYGMEAGTLQMANDWHFGRKVSRPLNQPAQVLATFIANDDDGNLDNGTPHWDIYCEAASNHGYSCPAITAGVIIDHIAQRTKQIEGDVVLDADIQSTEAALDYARIVYRLGGGAWQTADFVNVGGTSYEATLPGLMHMDEIEYYLEAADLNGLTRTFPGLAPDLGVFAFDIAQTYTAMESASGWTVNLEGLDTATATPWENVIPVRSPIAPGEDTTPGTGNRCWVTLNGPDGGFSGQGDIDFGFTTLYSPVYDMSGASQLIVKYSKWFSNNTGSGANQDPWVVQVRNDGGAWMDVENTLTSTDGWETARIDLMPIVGTPGSLQFKFIGSDENPPSFVDAGIDDFRILGILGDTSDSPETGAALSFALRSAAPNPSNGPVSIGFQVPTQADVDIRIFDVSGREVTVLARGSYGAGAHVIDWDGRDSRGQNVASGVYFYRMQANEYEATRSLTLQK
ncbi:MAG: FlgD immunoglobulin-like domain containing protein [Candidatus Eisenbacteria bacterium]